MSRAVVVGSMGGAMVQILDPGKVRPIVLPARFVNELTPDWARRLEQHRLGRPLVLVEGPLDEDTQRKLDDANATERRNAVARDRYYNSIRERLTEKPGSRAALRRLRQREKGKAP